MVWNDISITAGGGGCTQESLTPASSLPRLPFLETANLSVSSYSRILYTNCRERLYPSLTQQPLPTTNICIFSSSPRLHRQKHICSVFKEVFGEYPDQHIKGSLVLFATAQYCMSRVYCALFNESPPLVDVSVVIRQCCQKTYSSDILHTCMHVYRSVVGKHWQVPKSWRFN